MGAIWSRRDKNEANTVLATVTQFNAVSFRVISSILIEPKLKPQVSVQLFCRNVILKIIFIFSWNFIGKILNVFFSFGLFFVRNEPSLCLLG